MTISRFINKYLIYISTSAIVTQHAVTKLLTIVSTIVFNLIVNVIPKFGADLAKTLSVVKIRNLFSGKN